MVTNCIFKNLFKNLEAFLYIAFILGGLTEAYLSSGQLKEARSNKIDFHKNVISNSKAAKVAEKHQRQPKLTSLCLVSDVNFPACCGYGGIGHVVL